MLCESESIFNTPSF